MAMIFPFLALSVLKKHFNWITCFKTWMHTSSLPDSYWIWKKRMTIIFMVPLNPALRSGDASLMSGCGETVACWPRVSTFLFTWSSPFLWHACLIFFLFDPYIAAHRQPSPTWEDRLPVAWFQPSPRGCAVCVPRAYHLSSHWWWGQPLHHVVCYWDHLSSISIPS